MVRGWPVVAFTARPNGRSIYPDPTRSGVDAADRGSSCARRTGRLARRRFPPRPVAGSRPAVAVHITPGTEPQQAFDGYYGLEAYGRALLFLLEGWAGRGVGRQPKTQSVRLRDVRDIILPMQICPQAGVLPVMLLAAGLYSCWACWPRPRRQYDGLFDVTRVDLARAVVV